MWGEKLDVGTLKSCKDTPWATVKGGLGCTDPSHNLAPGTNASSQLQSYLSQQSAMIRSV